MEVTTTEAMRLALEALEALESPIGRGPTWALIERYADAVCEYNTALRIDVGVDKAGAECLSVEMELRVHLAAMRQAIKMDGLWPVPGAVWREGSVSLVQRGKEDDYCRRRNAHRLFMLNAPKD